MDKVTHVLNKKLLNAVTMDTDLVSPVQNIQQVAAIAVQHIWSGASGTLLLTVEGSNDGDNFTVIDTTNIVSASGSKLLNIEKAAYAYLRISLDQTTGAGTLTSILNGKAI